MHHGLLVLGGFVLGTVGMKAAQSRQVRKACVRVTACGLEAKDYFAHVVDEARAQCDDIMNEAEELKEAETAECESKLAVVEDASAQ